MCSTLVGDWRDTWTVTVSPQDTVVNVVCNEEISHFTFQKQTKESLLLAGVRLREEIVFLYTVTMRQATPISTSCTTKKCFHANSYDKNWEDCDTLFVASIDTQENVENESHDQVDVLADSDSVNSAGTVHSDQSEQSGQSEQSVNSDTDLPRADRGKHTNYWVS